jgi:hypothetical protein
MKCIPLALMLLEYYTDLREFIIYIYKYKYRYRYKYRYKYKCIYIYTRACIYMYIYIRRYFRVCVHMYVHVYLLNGFNKTGIFYLSLRVYKHILFEFPHNLSLLYKHLMAINLLAIKSFLTFEIFIITINDYCEFMKLYLRHVDFLNVNFMFIKCTK